VLLGALCLFASSWLPLGSLRQRFGLGLSTRGAASITAGRPSTVTYREPSPDGRLISLETATASVRAFSGRDALELAGGLQSASVDQGRYPVFYIEPTVSDSAGSDSFRVDARSGEVIEATEVGQLAAPAGTDLSPIEAEQQAERFVTDRFLGFSTLNLVDRSVAPAANENRLYVFKWAMLASESGAELPTSVSVALATSTGQMVWYRAQRESVQIDSRPVVSRESAVSSTAAVVEQGGIWDSRSPSSVRLQVLHDPDNRQQLVWSISFPARAGATAARSSLRVLVNATSGELIVGW
jgi:hypothetical protein